jgi:hypothetical protein
MRPLAGQEMLLFTQRNQRRLVSNVALYRVGAESLECGVVMWVLHDRRFPGLFTGEWSTPYRAPMAPV